ncbi:MAG: nitroreductase [Candidatus Berkiella sp.]
MKNKDDNLLNTEVLDVLQAIRDRRSVRAFLDKPVPTTLIQQILDTARFAPSGVNTQPWQVAVIGPLHRQKITADILKAKDQDIKENPDYQYYPTEWYEPFKERRKACGLALYGALHIDKGDIEKRKQQWYRNYAFFEAPAALIFYLDAKLCKGSWMDMGMFLQNVMLAARHFGLETCPQAALAEYPDIVRAHLNISSDFHIVCGMALGFADWSHPINQYRTAREEVESFTQWFD